MTNTPIKYYGGKNGMANKIIEQKHCGKIIDFFLYYRKPQKNNK